MSEKKMTLEELKTMRDELKLKAHLLKMDAKEEWDELEQKWNKLSRDFEPTKEASKQVAEDIGAANSLLLSEIARGYQKLKESLKH